MSDTKAPWFRTPVRTPGRADPATPGRIPNPRIPAGGSKRKGRENRKERRKGVPQRQPGGAPSYKPYDYPRRSPRPTPERTPRPVSPPAKPGAFGRKVPKLRIPIVPALNVIDMVDNLVVPFFNPDPYVPPRLPTNYYWCTGPAPWPIVNYYTPPYWGGGGSCSVGVPLTGQANPAYPGVAVGLVRHYWTRDYHTVGGINRRAIGGCINRTGPALDPQPQPYSAVLPSTAFGPSSNPNIQRWLPSTLPEAFPGFRVGVATPVLEPAAIANPELAYEQDYQWSFQIGVGPAFGVPIRPGLPPISPGTPPTPVRPIPPVTRAPPQKGEKQRKVLTKTSKIGLALYKALDAASESAEVVDAVYDALPEDVKKRWNRPDRVGDNFGQYGLGGADWKLQALYHNWHRVDPVEAIKNIIKNELQDRVIGGMHKVLPNNTGQAHSQGEKKFAKLLDEWFEEELGL